MPVGPAGVLSTVFICLLTVKNACVSLLHMLPTTALDMHAGPSLAYSTPCFTLVFGQV
jgi:hypothetical protein